MAEPTIVQVWLFGVPFFCFDLIISGYLIVSNNKIKKILQTISELARESSHFKSRNR